MTEIQNPLITYIAWISDRDLDWADTIATDFFDSVETLYETPRLLNVSKETYDVKQQAFQDFLNEKLTEEGEKTSDPVLDWVEEGYDYDDDDHFQPGLRLSRLTAYLEKFIELNETKYIVELALQLFIHTDFMLFTYALKAGLHDLNDATRGRYVRYLLEGNVEKANREEQELDLSTESIAALLATKASWDNFIVEDFNQAVIFYYQIIRIYR
ncbi:MAG: hypothetical protein V4594_14670 [Bacteroidota bacterium]